MFKEPSISRALGQTAAPFVLARVVFVGSDDDSNHGVYVKDLRTPSLDYIAAGVAG